MNYRYEHKGPGREALRADHLQLEPVDRMLLDALIRIEAGRSELFALRRSCREGVCGSDAMNLNGKNGLACIARAGRAQRASRTGHLLSRRLPVIRDLIVDMSQFFKQYK